MKKEFVTYDQGITLKRLGFDERCLTGFSYEDDKLLAESPLKQQVFEWVRNKYGYHVSIRKRYFQNVAEVEYNYFIYPPNSNEHLEHNLLDEYESWEEAEIACIDDLIKLVKQK